MIVAVFRGIFRKLSLGKAAVSISAQVMEDIATVVYGRNAASSLKKCWCPRDYSKYPMSYDGK